ncbi:MAG: RidA family protein [Actinobacteria bacterium]|nr:RidA family protein [Actinomycetota bacterium]
MKKQISTPLAPGAIGPYSQAIRVGDLLFISGQLPVDPSTGILEQNDIAVQTERAMQNIMALVQEAGFTPADIVKTSCLLADLADFPLFNEIYARFFSEEPPARETYQVAALPLDARVEISAVCAR